MHICICPLSTSHVQSTVLLSSLCCALDPRMLCRIPETVPYDHQPLISPRRSLLKNLSFVPVAQSFHVPPALQASVSDFPSLHSQFCTFLSAKNREGAGGRKWAVDAKALLCTLCLWSSQPELTGLSQGQGWGGGAHSRMHSSPLCYAVSNFGHSQ